MMPTSTSNCERNSRLLVAADGRSGSHIAVTGTSYRPVIFSTAQIAERASTSNAALNTRMSCVLG